MSGHFVSCCVRGLKDKDEEKEARIGFVAFALRVASVFDSRKNNTDISRN